MRIEGIARQEESETTRFERLPVKAFGPLEHTGFRPRISEVVFKVLKMCHCSVGICNLQLYAQLQSSCEDVVCMRQPGLGLLIATARSITDASSAYSQKLCQHWS